MKKFLYLLLFGMLTIIILSACTGQQGSPTAAGTIVPGDQIASPTALQPDTAATATTATPAVAETSAVDLTATLATSTDVAGAATDTTQTAVVPVTGADLGLLEGQFCIEGIAHALLVLPDTATFETVADTTTLSTPGPDTGCNTVDRYSGRQIVICRGQQNTSLNLNICTDGNNCTPLLVELHSCTDTAEPGATNPPEVGIPTTTPAAGLADTPPAFIITVVTP